MYAHAHLDIYRDNRFMATRARQRMADLYDPQTGRLSRALVAAAAPSATPQNCCALGLCQHSMVASAARRKSCCIAGTCFSNGWSVHH